jgi:hypothetical protein
MFDFLFEDGADAPVKTKAGLTPASKMGSAPAMQRDRVTKMEPPHAWPPPPASVPDDDPTYAQMKAKSDPYSQPAMRELEGYLEPLKGIITDPIKLYQAAIAQASAKSGITADKVVASFDAALASLESDRTIFEQKLESVTQRELTSKEDEVKGIDQKQADLQSQIKDLDTQRQLAFNAISLAKTKLQSAQSKFEAAYTRRKSEIEQQKSEITAVLR